MLYRWIRFSHRNPLISQLLIGAAILITWVLTRVAITRTPKNIYLIWNLFLATVPYWIARYMQNKTTVLSTTKKVLLLGVWILFLPNAPYIITDLVHVHPNNGLPLWFDYLKIFFAATMGLIWGFLSIRIIESLFLQKVKGMLQNIIRAALFFLIAYGVYLGRFLRWNSWDIFIYPREFIISVLGSICIETIGFVFGYGIILFSLYSVYIRLNKAMPNSDVCM